MSSTRAAEAVSAALPRERIAAAPVPRVVFVLGGPGAGKGTQCARLAERMGFVHLSAGDLLREERARGGPKAELIESIIRDGGLVPVEISVGLIHAAMTASGATKFLVDGFPRNQDNVDGWQRVVGDAAVVDAVLVFDVPDSKMTARLLERGKTSGRSDDNEETIRKRLRSHAELTVPIIEHYSKLGKVRVIAGDRPVDVVFEDAKLAVKDVIVADVLAHNQLVLDAISAGDWAAYERACSPDLTCHEHEHLDGLLVGLDFHKSAFESGARSRAAAALAGNPVAWTKSTMHDPVVTLLGDRSAVVAYTRHITPLNSDGPIRRVAETRVWNLDNERKWKLVHLHRSQMPTLP